MMKKGSQKERDLEKQVSEMYTPLSVAKKEIWRRWNDKELRKKVEDFLGKDLPEVYKRKPKCSFFRFITTPNLEFQLAYDMAKLENLELVFMEFLSDKFCTRNQDKLYLGKMVFYHEKNGENESIKHRKKVIDIEKCENKCFKDIKTLWGEDFIKFHRRLTSKKYGKIKNFDVSNFKTNGENAYEVYLKVFSLFVCNGILFENYFVSSNKDERKFTSDVIIPAFKKINEIFGIKPLIVPLVNREEDGYLFWQFYPDDLINEIKK
jgi:hypothetical protein